MKLFCTKPLSQSRRPLHAVCAITRMYRDARIAYEHGTYRLRTPCMLDPTSSHLPQPSPPLHAASPPPLFPRTLGSETCRFAS
eukprot:1778368-Rhodomonas_salina.1